MNYIVEEMDKLGADGVDFVPVCTSKDKPFKTIYSSKTREEMLEAKIWPRSGRLYWKLVDGHKVYLD